MRLLIISILMLFIAATAIAQSDVGTITGAVSDTSGAPIVGVAIRVKNVESGAVINGMSGPNGIYSLAKVAPGKYELTASSFGYKTQELKDIVVQAGQSLRLNVNIGDFISLDTLGEDRNTLGRIMLSRPPAPTGPAPRTSDGKPDFSGLWYGPSPLGGGGEAAPDLLPWADAVAKQRIDNNLKESPSARCLPFNLGFFNTFLNRVVQSRDFLTTIIEYDVPGYRQVYLDGRAHPKDLDPSWTGHSVGKWDGDTLVIETIGFNDKTWLGEAAPHTDKLKVTTRLRRPDLGHLEMESTIEDPGALKKPWMTKGVAILAPANEEIPEFICNENNQDAEHLVGK
jgi:hypothetical protein